MSREHDTTSTEPKLALLNYLLSQMSLLPARRDDENLLYDEGDLIREKHRLDVEYLVTKGQGMSDKSLKDADRAEAKQRDQAVETAVIGKSHFRMSCSFLRIN